MIKIAQFQFVKTITNSSRSSKSTYKRRGNQKQKKKGEKR